MTTTREENCDEEAAKGGVFERDGRLHKMSKQESVFKTTLQFHLCFRKQCRINFIVYAQRTVETRNTSHGVSNGISGKNTNGRLIKDTLLICTQ